MSTVRTTKFTYKALRANIKQSRKDINELLESVSILITSTTEENIVKNAKILKEEINKFIRELNELKKVIPKKGFAKTTDEEYEWIKTNGKIDKESARLAGLFTDIMETFAIGTDFEGEFKELKELTESIEKDLEVIND